MITVPVSYNHDHNKPIGFLSIDETQLPLCPNWCLTLGYKVLGDSSHFVKEEYMGSYELVSLRVSLDREYKDYLDRYLTEITPAPTTLNP